MKGSKVLSNDILVSRVLNNDILVSRASINNIKDISILQAHQQRHIGDRLSLHVSKGSDKV